MEVNGSIQDIINSEVLSGSRIGAQLLFKIASSINGLCSAMSNIGTDEFTTSSVWTSPADQVCWVVAIGVGGGGGGGGAAPRPTDPDANIGDNGSNGLDGGDTLFGSNIVAEGGAGGDGGIFGAPFLDGNSSYRICERNRIAIEGAGGRGTHYTRKITNFYGFGPSMGSGGTSANYEIKIFKDIAPNTGYDVIIGQGGARGVNHPLLNDDVNNSSALIKNDSLPGSDGYLKLIYSGY